MLTKLHHVAEHWNANPGLCFLGCFYSVFFWHDVLEKPSICPKPSDPDQPDGLKNQTKMKDKMQIFKIWVNISEYKQVKKKFLGNIF